jgi:hypothetical protein
MHPPRLHICLVSDQLSPNILPMLMPELRPEHAVLLCTGPRRGSGERLAGVVRGLGVRVEQRLCPDYDLDGVRTAVAEALRDGGGSAAVNITGGTKIMSLGAFQAAREAGAQALYADTANDLLRVLDPVQRDIPLPPDLLDLDTALAAAGYARSGPSSDAAPPDWIEPLALELFRGVENFSKVYPALNRIASRAEGSLSASVGRTIHDPAFRELVRVFQDRGQLEVARDTAVFRSEEARRRVNGGWLEEFVQLVVQRLMDRGVVLHAEANLVAENAQGVKNELDAAFLARNRLHIIECKTRRFAGREDRADAAAYKLETLRDVVGGTFGRAMLVSYLPLSRPDSRRCQAYRIRPAYGRGLADLEDRIIQWIRAN